MFSTGTLHSCGVVAEIKNAHASMYSAIRTALEVIFMSSIELLLSLVITLQV